MIAEQSRRLETVEELGPAASPSLKAEAFFQSRAAALSQVRKTEFCDLFEPCTKPGGGTFAYTDGGNSRVKHVQQFDVRETPREMTGGNKSSGAAP